MGTAAGNISLPEPLLAEIRNAAEAQHRTADELAANALLSKTRSDFQAGGGSRASESE